MCSAEAVINWPFFHNPNKEKKGKEERKKMIFIVDQGKEIVQYMLFSWRQRWKKDQETITRRAPCARRKKKQGDPEMLQ